jgi:hypothetical protein
MAITNSQKSHLIAGNPSIRIYKKLDVYQKNTHPAIKRALLCAKQHYCDLSVALKQVITR